MTFTTEDRAWHDAYHIAWVGASNRRGVQRSLEQHTATLGIEHPAVRAIRGHLDFLNHKSLGPEFADLDAVKAHGARLGICDERGNYIPVGQREASAA